MSYLLGILIISFHIIRYNSESDKKINQENEYSPLINAFVEEG